MKKLFLLGLMCVLLVGVVNAVCSVAVPTDCLSKSTCEAVNGTWYSGACYGFQINLTSYYSYDVNEDDDFGGYDGTPSGDAGAVLNTTRYAVGNGSFTFHGNGAVSGDTITYGWRTKIDTIN